MQVLRQCRVPVVLALVLAGVLAGGGSAAAARETAPVAAYRSFFMPSGTIVCAMNDGASAAFVYCWTLTPRVGARLNGDGSVKACRGELCGHRFAAPPSGSAALPYGSSATVGRFRCSSAPNGVTCVVAATGKGFRIARQGTATGSRSS